MLAELNQMLEQRERGEEPDFDGFMERYGDFFPGNPQTLDELLEQMAQSMAQMQQLLNSMTPEQRAQLQALSRVAARGHGPALAGRPARRATCSRRSPTCRGSASQNFRGDDPLQFGEMPGLLDTLGDLDALENLHAQSATQPGRARRGRPRPRPRAARRRRRPLARAAARARRRCSRKPGSSSSARAGSSSRRRAIRAIGNKALGDLYRKLMKDRAGRHEIERTGFGHERAYEHKPYEFGDPFHLNVQETVKNAIWRVGCGHAGAALARGLRGRAHRDAHPLGHRADARRVALDADARQLPAGQEGRDGAARAHHHAVPARLLRAGVASGASPAR